MKTLNKLGRLPRFIALCTSIFNFTRTPMVVVTMVLLASCGRCGWGTYYLRGTQSYSGDGVISDVSQPGGLFGTRAYIIDFPKFDLSQRYAATYHFSGTPTLGWAKSEIALMIEDPRGWLGGTVDGLKEASKGTLKCSLVDSSGKVITRFETPLKNLIWSGPIHDRSGYALYDLDNSFFRPNSDAKYTLTIEYSGDAQLVGKTGWIYVWCGCGGS